MYIGGISYFSSGSGKRPLGGVCAEAVASPDSKSKQMKKRVVDTIKNLRLKKGDRISEHTRGVDQIFSTQTGHGRSDNDSTGIVLRNDERKIVGGIVIPRDNGGNKACYFSDACPL